MEYSGAFPSATVSPVGDQLLASLLEVGVDALAFAPNPLPSEEDSLPGVVVPVEPKSDHEGGEEDDEGFEDFCEDEENTLIRNPSAATPGDHLNLEDLPDTSELEDLFLPGVGLEEEKDFLTSSIYDPVLAYDPVFCPVKLPSDEILELDQGVAMEISLDHHSYNDLPLATPIPPTTLTSAPATSSPSPFLASPSMNTRFVFPPVTNDPSPLIVPSKLPDQFVLSQTTSPATVRQDSELDLICSVLSEGMKSKESPISLAELRINQAEILLDNSSPLSVSSCDGSYFAGDNNSFSSRSSPSPLTTSSSPSPLLLSGATDNRGSQTDSNETPVNTKPFDVSPDSDQYSRSKTSLVSTSSEELSPSPDTRQRHAATIDSNSIVEMPFYNFKKMLDSTEVSEIDKEQAKAVRRRGKNKLAAKNCRQRKIDIVNGLQYEIQLLKSQQEELIRRTKVEENLVLSYKNRCSEILRSRNCQLQSIY